MDGRAADLSSSERIRRATVTHGTRADSGHGVRENDLTADGGLD
jgi:hypothetical protein